MYINGFLVTTDEPLRLAWPLEAANEKTLGLEHYAYYPEVSTNWLATYEYWKKCLDKSIPAKLLLVKTIFCHPKVIIPTGTKWQFLGYDVGCPGGSWYSAISDEILSQPIFNDWRCYLNENKLFKRMCDALNFLNFRRNILNSDCDVDIETGVEVTVIGLWQFQGFLKIGKAKKLSMRDIR
jgi:hypothetical protein